MTAAFCATNLGANHAVASIFQKFNGVTLFWGIETRPTAVSVKLGFTLEKLGTATSAAKSADTVFV